MENFKMKKYELGVWLFLRGFFFGVKRSFIYLYIL